MPENWRRAARRKISSDGQGMLVAERERGEMYGCWVRFGFFFLKKWFGGVWMMESSWGERIELKLLWKRNSRMKKNKNLCV